MTEIPYATFLLEASESQGTIDQMNHNDPGRRPSAVRSPPTHKNRFCDRCGCQLEWLPDGAFLCLICTPVKLRRCHDS